MKLAHRVDTTMGRAVAVLAAGAAAIVVGIFLYVSACGADAADAGPAVAGCSATWGVDGSLLALAAALGLVGAALGWWRFLAVLGTLLIAAGAPFASTTGLTAIPAGAFHLVAAWAAHRGNVDRAAPAFTRG